MAHESPGTFDVEAVRRQLAAAIGAVAPRLSASDREDLVQSALVRLLQIFARSGPKPLTSSYLWRTAHSVLLDEWRRAARRNEFSVAPGDFDLQSSPAVENPERRSTAAALRRALLECIGELPIERRRAVVMQWLGYSPAQTGRQLNWSTKRAANLCYRGVAALRDCLIAKGITP